MSNDNLLFKIPAKPQFISVVRLTTSGIANSMMFDIDGIEDIVMCVSEACNIIINSELEEEITIEYELKEEEIRIKISDFNPSYIEKSDNTRMSDMIIRSLMDEVDCKDNLLELVLKVG